MTDETSKLKERIQYLEEKLKAYEEARLKSYEDGTPPEDAESPSNGFAYLVRLKNANLFLLGVRDDGVWRCSHPLMPSRHYTYKDEDIAAVYPLPQMKEESQ